MTDQEFIKAAKEVLNLSLFKQTKNIFDSKGRKEAEEFLGLYFRGDIVEFLQLAMKIKNNKN
jgi:hypothetical protein